MRWHIFIFFLHCQVSSDFVCQKLNSLDPLQELFKKDKGELRGRFLTHGVLLDMMLHRLSAVVC